MAQLIRMLDLLGAVVGLMIAGPIMLVVATAVRLSSPGPILFVQTRVGRNNRHFNMYKFRSMYVGTPEVAKEKLAGAMKAHVTPVGAFIRRTSLDELPQLFNVIMGDMSLVGPRPALYNQSDLIRMRTEAGVHQLRPGLTGLAQINGREDMSLEDKVRFDRQLVESMNPFMYMRIILRTFFVLFSARGTY